eukprot:scaffold1655_cov247-Pinguiococcus_pyrenoidosus.AAC.3
MFLGVALTLCLASIAILPRQNSEEGGSAEVLRSTPFFERITPAHSARFRRLDDVAVPRDHLIDLRIHLKHTEEQTTAANTLLQAVRRRPGGRRLLDLAMLTFRAKMKPEPDLGPDEPALRPSHEQLGDSRPLLPHRLVAQGRP